MTHGFYLDETGQNELAVILGANGWKGAVSDLHELLNAQHDATSLRVLESSWVFGEGTKRMVFGMIACGKLRHCRVVISNMPLVHAGPRITLFYPEGSKLRSLAMEVKGHNEVYVIRRFADDEWISTRTFHPKD